MKKKSIVTLLGILMFLPRFVFGSDPYFVPVWTGNGVDHMNFYAITAILDGADLEAGDEIAVFDGEHCVGAGVLQESLVPGQYYLSFVASKNDAVAPAVNGYTPDNPVSFRIYDISEQREIIKVEAEYISGTGTFSIGGTASFHLTAKSTVDQVISLLEGWNIISFFHMPENTNLMDIFQPLIDNGTLIKVQDETGAALEYVVPIGWVNNLGEFDPTKGYKIKVSSTTELLTEGYEVSDTIQIDLLEGWNIMGYPFDQPQDASQAFAEMIAAGTLLKVQDEAGNAIEYVFPIGWIYNIDQLEPGEGYKIKVTENTVLKLYRPDNKGMIENTGSKGDDLQHFTRVWSGNGVDHMNFYIISAKTGDADLQPGDEIAVYDGEYCVGAGALTEVLSEGGAYLTFVASKNDANPPEVNGYTPGNTYSFRFWDASEDREISAIDVELLSGGTSFVIGGTVSCKLTGSVNQVPVITGQNPVSTEEETTIRLTLDMLTVEDPDNTYPDDFVLLVFPGDNYTLDGTDITPVTDFYGTLYVPVRVNDGQDDSDEFNLEVTVTNVNDVPYFTSTPVLEATRGEVYLYNVTAEDADPDDILVIASTELPQWLSLTDHGDGTATLTGTPGAADPGSSDVVLTLTDQVISSPVQQSFTISVVTGISELQDQTGMEIYPNPASDQLRIMITNHQGKDGLIRIVDMTGKLHLEKKLRASDLSDNGFSLEIRTLPRGVYLVKWTCQDNTFFNKFVKK